VQVEGYDSGSHSITAKNGFAIFLGCGFPPSFYETGMVELSLSTSAFDAVLCSDDKKSVISAGRKGGGRVGFIEKSSKEWWSKYCILVT
jgi:hypothetical protein